MISIIVPARNEEDKIAKTLYNLIKEFREAEIIVVCNDCKDSTYDIVNGIKKRYKNIVNLNFFYHTGKGGAIIEGFKKARGEIVGFIDADNVFYTKDINRIITYLDKYDCVIASKWKRGFSRVSESLLRKIYGRFWNLFIRLLFNLQFSDTQAGLKFMRRNVLKSLDGFTCKEFEFDAELLWKIQKSGFEIKEEYVKTRNMKEDKFSIKDALSMFFNIMKLRLV